MTFSQSKWQGKIMFIFPTASRLALVSIQPPIQSEMEALSLGVEWLGYEADHSVPSTAEDECSHTFKALEHIYLHLLP
jgi:hypothetical protein